MKLFLFVPSRFRARFGFLCTLLTTLTAPTFAADNGWISLFDGVSLAGWKANENSASFRVVDGAIATDGPRSHLFYVGTGTTPVSFENFEFSAEVMTKPNANSGIYFHTSWLEQGWPTQQGFEVQVDNSQPLQGTYIENKRTGSLYGIRNVYPQLVRDNEWFTISITVRKPRVEISVNGVLVVDYVEPVSPLPAGAPKFNHLGGGAFALQAHDPESHAFFRNLRVRPLPATAHAGVEQRELDSETAQLLPLAKDNFPLVDLNTIIPAGRLERALAQSRATGLGLGIVANESFTSPSLPLSAALKNSTRPGPMVRTESSAADFLAAIGSQPVFRVLWAVDRNWTKTISLKRSPASTASSRTARRLISTPKGWIHRCSWRNLSPTPSPSSRPSQSTSTARRHCFPSVSSVTPRNYGRKPG